MTARATLSGPLIAPATLRLRRLVPACALIVRGWEAVGSVDRGEEWPTYLAQARSTEVAARSDWMKARLALDRSLGSLLDVNNIQLGDAIEGRVR